MGRHGYRTWPRVDAARCVATGDGCCIFYTCHPGTGHFLVPSVSGGTGLPGRPWPNGSQGSFPDGWSGRIGVRDKVWTQRAASLRGGGAGTAPPACLVPRRRIQRTDSMRHCLCVFSCCSHVVILAQAGIHGFRRHTASFIDPTDGKDTCGSPDIRTRPVCKTRTDRGAS